MDRFSCSKISKTEGHFYLGSFSFFSIFEIDLKRNISTGHGCGSAFDLSPSCRSGCRLLFYADADQTFHLDLDLDPDPSFQIKGQTLEKVLK
jgi:hypothetical protein